MCFRIAGRRPYQRIWCASIRDQLFGNLERDYAQVRALVPALFEGRARTETRIELETVLSRIGDHQQLLRSELMAERVQPLREDGKASGD